MPAMDEWAVLELLQRIEDARQSGLCVYCLSLRQPIYDQPCQAWVHPTWGGHAVGCRKKVLTPKT
jgi:hypothetical protein